MERYFAWHRAMDDACKDLGLPIITVVYEHLLQDTAPYLEKLLKFMGVTPPEEQVREAWRDHQLPSAALLLLSAEHLMMLTPTGAALPCHESIVFVCCVSRFGMQLNGGSQSTNQTRPASPGT